MQDKNLRLKRAQQAENFLNNELVKQLILGTKDRYFIQWANTASNEVEKRERIHAEYRGLVNLVNDLRNFVVDGNVVKQQQKEAEDGGT